MTLNRFLASSRLKTLTSCGSKTGFFVLTGRRLLRIFYYKFASLLSNRPKAAARDLMVNMRVYDL